MGSGVVLLHPNYAVFRIAAGRRAGKLALDVRDDVFDHHLLVPLLDDLHCFRHHCSGSPVPAVSLVLPFLREGVDSDLPAEIGVGGGDAPRPRNSSQKHHLRNMTLALNLLARGVLVVNARVTSRRQNSGGRQGAIQEDDDRPRHP